MLNVDTLQRLFYADFITFPMFIYLDLVAMIRVFSNAIQRTTPGTTISTNGGYMTVCVKMTFAAFRGHEQGNTRMLAYEVIESGPPFPPFANM